MILLTIFVHPRAKKTAIVEQINENTIKMHVAANPEKGQANKELIYFLAKALGIIQSKIHIIRGKTTPMKYISIDVSQKIFSAFLQDQIRPLQKGDSAKYAKSP